MYDNLVNKDAKLALVGLGYVGLPIALEFAKKIKVIGFDINPDRVELMRKGIDPSKELASEDFEDKDIFFTSNPEDLKEADFFIVAVPTPVDRHKVPDLTPLLKASETVGKALKKGSYVVFESTVYPGCTEEDCLPILEKYSGMKVGEDFKIGYSPERINPGDKEHTLSRIVKVVSGWDNESLDSIAKVYELVVTAGVHRASSIKVAEAAKIIENTQRDVNIALMNELSIIFNRIGINTYEVLEAASTKWNFLKFTPGLVGGHCIGVDPYYLTYKSLELGYEPEVILGGRKINDEMGAQIAQDTVKELIKAGKAVKDARVLIMGATFKEDVSDIRNSKVIDVVKELKSFGVNVEVVDPHANPAEIKHEYGFDLCPEIGNNYDAIIVAVNHKSYTSLSTSYFESIMNKDSFMVDLKGIYRNKVNGMRYRSL